MRSPKDYLSMQFINIDLHPFMNGASFIWKLEFFSKAFIICSFSIEISLGRILQNSFSILVTFPNKAFFTKEYWWDQIAKIKCVSQKGLCYNILIEWTT